MQKAKLNNSKVEIQKKFSNWLFKISFLKNQIEKLEKLKNEGLIISVPVFLLKCQLIEFELKQIIFYFDFYLHSLLLFQNSSLLLNRQIRTPKDLDGLTLGKLVEEFKQFEVSSNSLIVSEFKQLQKNLDSLVEMRNEFTHRLFGPEKNLEELERNGLKGIEIANEIIKSIDSLRKQVKKKLKLIYGF